MGREIELGHVAGGLCPFRLLQMILHHLRPLRLEEVGCLLCFVVEEILEQEMGTELA